MLPNFSTPSTSNGFRRQQAVCRRWRDPRPVEQRSASSYKRRTRWTHLDEDSSKDHAAHLVVLLLGLRLGVRPISHSTKLREHGVRIRLWTSVLRVLVRRVSRRRACYQEMAGCLIPARNRRHGTPNCSMALSLAAPSFSAGAAAAEGSDCADADANLAPLCSTHAQMVHVTWRLHVGMCVCTVALFSTGSCV